MGAKVKKLEGASGTVFVFLCPGCKYEHPFRTISNEQPNRPVWTFNGDLEKPTFSPSLLVGKDFPASRCHLFVKDGRIEFLSDCHHSLKGQTVEMGDYDDAG
jgi:hypothetical protein